MQTITRGDSFQFPVDTGEFSFGWIGELESRSETAAFVSGSGVDRPRGILFYASDSTTQDDDARSWAVLQHIVTGANGGFPTISGSTAGDASALYDAKAALHSELRAGAVWGMNSTTLATLEKLRDADGRPLIKSSASGLDAPTPKRLLGFPIAIMEDMPDVGSGSYSIMFANLEEGYQIVDRPGVRVLRDPYTQKGKTIVYGYRRTGGDVSNFDAIKLIKFSS